MDLKKEDLNTHYWEDIHDAPDIDNQVSMWPNTYLYLTYEKANISSWQVTICQSDPKWLTLDVKRLQRRRNRLHQKAKKRNQGDLYIQRSYTQRTDDY